MRDRTGRQAAGPLSPTPTPGRPSPTVVRQKRISGWGCGGARAVHRLMGGAHLQAATEYPASPSRRRPVSRQAECESDRHGKNPTPTGSLLLLVSGSPGSNGICSQRGEVATQTGGTAHFADGPGPTPYPRRVVCNDPSPTSPTADS